jgi:hypothetical protein
MAKKKDRKNLPIIDMSKEEREEVRDDLFIKEEGIILEFNPDLKKGKIKSLDDGGIYDMGSRELLRTNIELSPRDKVLFAPFEDPEGKDYARVIQII